MPTMEDLASDGGIEDTHQQPKQETWPSCSAMILSCLMPEHPCFRQRAKEEHIFVGLPGKGFGPGGPFKPPNVFGPMGPRRSSETYGATLHLGCGREGVLCL